MAPGTLLSRWSLGGRFSGAALVPVSFAISTGLFGLLGVPLLILHLDLGVYLLLCGVVVVASLAAAVFRTLRRWTPAEDKGDAQEEAGSSSWLWVPFTLLGSTLAFASVAKAQGFYGDLWVYLAWIREFLSTDSLGLYEPYFGDETGLSRVRINGWLLEQAALSRVSGLDPIELTIVYLKPTLVVVALLAFYALARTLLKSETAALFASCVFALFYLVNLDPSIFSYGGEFIGRIAEDKFVARFVFLPVALALAVAFLESRKKRYLAAFGFICWSVMAVHPVGLAIIGLSMAGFGLTHAALNARRRETWMMLVGLGTVLLSAFAIPAGIIFLATGKPITAILSDADINSGDPDVLANMVFVISKRERIYEFADGSYIMHPSLLLDPIIAAALVLGIPFLLWRLKRSLAAQLLLGTLILTTVICYVPPIATFVGDNLVLPGQLWRLAWPIPLAALLTLGWMGWEATRRAETYLNGLGAAARVTRFLPLVLVITLMAVAAPVAVAGIEEVNQAAEPTRGATFRFDPVFRWMGDNIEEPSVVLAPDAESTCIPAYSAPANVVSLRGAQILKYRAALERRVSGRIEVPQRALDVRNFYSGPTLEEGIGILRRNEVDYVLVHADSPLDEQLGRLPGFALMKTPGGTYSLYAVDRRRLGQ